MMRYIGPVNPPIAGLPNSAISEEHFRGLQESYGQEIIAALYDEEKPAAKSGKAPKAAGKES